MCKIKIIKKINACKLKSIVASPILKSAAISKNNLAVFSVSLSVFSAVYGQLVNFIYENTRKNKKNMSSSRSA